MHKKYSNSFIKLTPDVSWTIFLMSLLPLLALNVEVVLLSMQGQKAQFLQVWNDMRLKNYDRIYGHTLF